MIATDSDSRREGSHREVVTRQSDASKGASIFIGAILSLGSSSLIGNIIAGFADLPAQPEGGIVNNI